MKLKPYPKYKDSGIQWIGEIPEGWEVHKLKYKTIINEKKLEDDVNPNYVINYLDISNVDSDGNILDIEEQIFEDAPSRARRIPGSGDIILSTVRTYLKAIAYLENIPDNLIVSTGFAVLEPIKPINSKYFFYSTSSEVFIQNVIAYSKGVAYPAINPPELGQILIIIPSLPEQTTIANFLDKQNAKIDVLIAKDKKLIALLKEKRTALINHAVTEGLDPNVKLKDSGIDWIGEIPEGWEVHKLKYKTIINKKKLENDINPNYVINYLDISNVDSSGNLLDIEEQIFEDAPSRARRIPRSGDTILSTVRTYLKAIAYLENIPGNLIVSTGFAVLEPIQSINSKYLFYSTSSEVFIQNVIAYSKGVAYPAINPPELGQIPIIMPTLPEQTTIVNFLDNATAKIDKTIKLIEQKVNLLQEYKRSLIHQVVTGKVDVRGVEA